MVMRRIFMLPKKLMGLRKKPIGPPKKPIDPGTDQPQFRSVVLKTVTGRSEDGNPPPRRVFVSGIHPTREQAYAAAIMELIYDLEQPEGAPKPELRAIATTATLPLQDRLKSLQSCQDSDERAKFVIKLAVAFPEYEELEDMGALLEGEPLSHFYCWFNYPAEYDDDITVLANEAAAVQGIEGSGAKDEEEAKAEDQTKAQ